MAQPCSRKNSAEGGGTAQAAYLSLNVQNPEDGSEAMKEHALTGLLLRLFKPAPQTRAARSVEYFGWLDLALGIIIFVAPAFTASIFRLPLLTIQDLGYLRVVGVLVASLGMLYVLSGRLNSEGFVVASLLDRPLVPVIMVALWSRGILPGTLALAFSVSDFGGFVWTALAWRADVLHGEHIGGPGIQRQTRAHRSVELYGWLTLALGFIILIFPSFITSLLHLSTNSRPGPNYLQLVGLLVGGLGMLYVVSGSLNTEGIVVCSLLVRLISSLVVLALWWGFQIPGWLAFAFVAIHLGGFFWTDRKSTRLNSSH